MKLDIDSLIKGNKGILDLNFSLDLNTIDYYGDVIHVTSPVNVDGKVYLVNDRLYINLGIVAEMQANCSRCLESFTYQFKSSVNAEFVNENLYDEYSDELDDDIIFYKEGTVDLDELIKENIIMNIPMKLVCNKKCEGLCSHCGRKLNDVTCDCEHVEPEGEIIDPRMAKLKELLQQD